MIPVGVKAIALRSSRVGEGTALGSSTAASRRALACSTSKAGSSSTASTALQSRRGPAVARTGVLEHVSDLEHARRAIRRGPSGSRAATGSAAFRRIQNDWSRRERGPRSASRDPRLFPATNRRTSTCWKQKRRAPMTWLPLAGTSADPRRHGRRALARRRGRLSSADRRLLGRTRLDRVRDSLVCHIWINQRRGAEWKRNCSW